MTNIAPGSETAAATEAPEAAALWSCAPRKIPRQARGAQRRVRSPAAPDPSVTAPASGTVPLPEVRCQAFKDAASPMTTTGCFAGSSQPSSCFNRASGNETQPWVGPP